MNKFGEIKSKVEQISVDLFGKKDFTKFMRGLKSNILENKDLTEIFYIYDDLSSQKGLSKDIASDYVNESVEYCQILIENNKTSINKLTKWVSQYNVESPNNYKNIDTIVYGNSIRDLKSNVVLCTKRVISKFIKLFLFFCIPLVLKSKSTICFLSNVCVSTTSNNVCCICLLISPTNLFQLSSIVRGSIHVCSTT